MSQEQCGAWAGDGYCILPKGHNMGNLDIPSNHKAKQIELPKCARCEELEKKVSLLKDTSTHWPALMEQEKEIIGLQAKLAAAEQDRHCLADGIANMAIKIGIINEGTSLTGPQLLFLCNAIAEFKKGEKA